jgi:hypothetical protein
LPVVIALLLVAAGAALLVLTVPALLLAAGTASFRTARGAGRRAEQTRIRPAWRLRSIIRRTTRSLASSRAGWNGEAAAAPGGVVLLCFVGALRRILN